MDQPDFHYSTFVTANRPHVHTSSRGVLFPCVVAHLSIRVINRDGGMALTRRFMQIRGQWYALMKKEDLMILLGLL
jgi:hypothetical protein